MAIPTNQPFQNRKVWGVFRRKPTRYEFTALVMCLLFLLAAFLPPLKDWVYQGFRVAWVVGFIVLLDRDCDTPNFENPRYFYLLLWIAGMASTMSAFLGEWGLSRQTGYFIDLAWVVAILRGSYTYHQRDFKTERGPLL